jgi:RNase P/RNase MRP subunit p29
MDAKTSERAPVRGHQKPGLDFLCGELIGSRVTVLESSGKGLAGCEGVVADETKHTLVLDTARGKKTVPKVGCTFEFQGHSGVRVKGEWIAFRPADRTKKVADLLRRNRLR